MELPGNKSLAFADGDFEVMEMGSPVFRLRESGAGAHAAGDKAA